jgi:ATP-binding cassette subfamily B protein
VEEEVLGKAYDGRLMRRLLGYLRPYRKVVAVSLLALLVSSVLQTVGPLLMKLAIDRYLAPSKETLHTPLDAFLSAGAHTGLTQISVLYALVLLSVFAFDFVQTYLMQWTGQKAMLDLRRQLMRHLQNLDIAYYDKHPVGRLVTRVTTDVDVLNELFASGLIVILGDLLMLSFVVIVMLRLSPGLTGLMLAVMPFVVLTTWQFRRSVQQSYRRIRVAIAKINAYLQEHVTGMVVLQLFNREQKSREEFERINREHMDAFKQAILAYGWFYPIVEFLGMVSLALILSYGGFKIREGTMPLGTLVAFFFYGMRFFRPIQDLSDKYNILQGAMASSERIFKLLDTPVTIASLPVADRGLQVLPAPFPSGPLQVEFDRVWFAYHEEDWVLRDVSFVIDPGETIAVVGHTGAGKTTLISLLLRFYDIQRGSIRVIPAERGARSIDIRDFDPRDLRRHFGVVLQDPYLFTGTIEENIRLGTAGITEEDLVSAAEQVNLMDFIHSLPDGFSQAVRERGTGLSTGQKQLINFARALAHNPQFLILDEATSSVDTDTEVRVREALARMIEGRTSIIIAHRLSTIQRADRILVMHKGHLRESGTHQELLALRGIYWKLYLLQYKDQELAQSGTRVDAIPVASDSEPSRSM